MALLPFEDLIKVDVLDAVSGGDVRQRVGPAAAESLSYYAIHRKEIQQAAMQAAAQKTAEQMSNAIRSGQARPVENGTQAQAPSVTTFDYAHASREQREALKRQIREAAARGQKIYPGK